MTTVLFDLDGTLVDSLPGIAAAINETLGTSYSLDEIRPFVGPPLQTTFATLTDARGSEVDAIVADYRERYARLMIDGSVPYAGIPELLGTLRDAGRVLAVATSKARPLARDLLAGLGLDDYFAAIEGPVPPSHDDKTATIAVALTSLGLPPVATVTMVGDRHHDIEGARAHGVRAVGVAWGFGSVEELRVAGAATVVDTPEDLLGVLLPSA